MTEAEEQAAMKRHGITSEPRVIYRYAGRVYDNCQDALNYAEIVETRASEAEASRA